MKEDEERLHNLYSTSDICDENWVKEYREIGKHFKIINMKEIMKK